MRYYFTLAVAVAATLPIAWAQPPPPGLVTNGCGSGRFTFLVPNSTIISKCEFLQACNNHDLCYGKCLEGGSLNGNSTCNYSKEKTRRRTVCDMSLQQDIINDNPNNPLCSMYASLYRFAVQKMGEDYFHGIQGQGVSVTLNQFLEFVNNNPGVFEPADIERAFESINQLGLEGPNYTVIFQPGVPRLFVQHGDKLIVDVRGSSGKK